jgi:hypothetical protein
MVEMRVFAACVLIGCHATARPPTVSRVFAPIAITQASATPTTDPTQPCTASFLECVSPHDIDVPRSELFVTKREGPDAIDAQLVGVSPVMEACYSSTASIFSMARREDHITMTIDARTSETTVLVEPSTTPPELAHCLVRSLVASHFDAKHARVVLGIDGAKWFVTTTTSQLAP